MFSFDLAPFRRAAQALGASRNAVFVAGVTGGLLAYHERMGAPCDALRMAIPVSLRGNIAAGGAPAVSPVGGNRFAPARVVVPLGPKDPAKRVNAVGRTLASVAAEPGLSMADSLAGLISLLPASVLVPAFSVGFMAAARAAARRGPVELSLLFDGFRHYPKSQLILGALYLVCLGGVLGVSALPDDGALATWMLGGKRPADDVLQSEAFLTALACAAALYVPVLMMFWFAPPLAAWHGAGQVSF